MKQYDVVPAGQELGAKSAAAAEQGPALPEQPRGIFLYRSSAPLGAISSGFFRAESQLPCHAVTRV